MFRGVGNREEKQAAKGHKTAHNFELDPFRQVLDNQIKHDANDRLSTFADRFPLEGILLKASEPAPSAVMAQESPVARPGLLVKDNRATSFNRPGPTISVKSRGS